ncbi:monovalent cation/H+ antiporter complex subunit F [Janibacter corallicola]|uniref:monovalent cation/H+ antiporter complex subunit F n=1 Tax=Janibacter corallicola TaxID=415212 RepID=UPI000835261A|nr:monovalent cation/H+ antiporter complex subunit F [Janibacter corallicola]
MTAVIVDIALVLFIAAAALVLVRVLRGPTGLDRALSLDVAVVIITGIMSAQIMHSGDTSALPILVVFSMTGFVGSVSVARFMAREEDPK